ncbi:MAG: DUF6095 family protein [Pseudomonas sp.]|jgi:hypothetical protein|uniref:DUF6095 family protein n=1 Tax=Stutzerimonas stutzeri group TaxID=136846 RepID=UPI00028D4806|nr:MULTISPECIES: DUF6095 family protein [Stutzerimonas stutzeri group]MBV2205555.1 hypothetical protein [Pseudomonas sp.]EKM96467.1 hypothetical protein C211_07969 [Stutzerimonas degradans]MCQ4275121.1 DUF6095 family protein [Stutzerimonas degradans]MEB2326478.1 DUF6095 family protein [Pseudomonas sp.]NHC09301.1 hypothetical protein [Stutzerimonas degradans]
MDNLDWLLLLILTGFVLLCAGFANRDRQWGIVLLSLGIIVMFSTVSFKLYIALH